MFITNSLFSDCYERTITKVIETVNFSFLCDNHKTDVIATAVHYYVLMRMRQFKREQNRFLKKKKKNRQKKKWSKLCSM